MFLTIFYIYIRVLCERRKHHLANYLLPDLGGNPSTIFLLIFALIAGVIGACSVFSGFLHQRVWNSVSLASAASSAILAWATTVLAFGYRFPHPHPHPHPKVNKHIC